MSGSDFEMEMRRKWEKRSLWGNLNLPVGVSEEEGNRRARYCYQYMLRCLSRMHVPNPELVEKTMSGELPVPPCGFIGCSLEIEHVH